MSGEKKTSFTIFSKAHSKEKLSELYTIWGEQFKRTSPLAEYPRPQLKRTDYHCLNGVWEYDILKSPQTGETPDFPPAGFPGNFLPKGEIIVPYSPECALSEVRHILQPDEILLYRKQWSLTSEELQQLNNQNKRCILHFGAVDQEAVVYVNDREVLRHSGGYLPFHADITPYITDDTITIQVAVRDFTDTSYYSRGKQTLERGGMFYTPQSGIWQTVWYEWVPDRYIESLRITPHFEESMVELQIHTNATINELCVRIGAPDADYREQDPNTIPTDLAPTSISLINHLVLTGGGCVTTLEIHFPDDDFEPWTPALPYLYPLHITADEDRVASYFAMRCFTIEDNDLDAPVFCLNHTPLFLHGVLDQGYWPESLMTPPADEAFVSDIQLAKSLGFNMIRKHIKIEPLRWYYHCDRLGMIVWQDMVNGGGKPKMPFVCYLPTALPFVNGLIKDTADYGRFSRDSLAGREFFKEECRETIDHLYNVPSLAVWVPFNEGWGQFAAAKIAENIAHQDPTRLVDHASGWFDQGAGDFCSVHNYFRKLKIKKQSYRGFCISEYGGYACLIPGHSSVERIYGYKKFENIDTLNAAYGKLIHEQLMPLVSRGLSGAVYTQLSDIEEEVNGLVSYDRKIVKIDTAAHICHMPPEERSSHEKIY